MIETSPSVPGQPLKKRSGPDPDLLLSLITCLANRCAPIQSSLVKPKGGAGKRLILQKQGKANKARDVAWMERTLLEQLVVNSFS
jgi:hypothetical protein